MLLLLEFKNIKMTFLTFTLVSAVQSMALKTVTENNDSNNQLMYQTMTLWDSHCYYKLKG